MLTQSHKVKDKMQKCRSFNLNLSSYAGRADKKYDHAKIIQSWKLFVRPKQNARRGPFSFYSLAPQVANNSALFSDTEIEVSRKLTLHIGK